MLTRSAVFLLALVLVGCGAGQQEPEPASQAAAPQASQTSLYQRLGGLDAITAVTDAFIAKASTDPRISAKFAKTDVPRLRFHLIEQLCAVTGGPCDYTGRDMPTAHRNMAVTDGEFDALVEDLVAALDQFKVQATEKNELLGLLAPLRSAIVTAPGTATGTPLPAGFQPGLPLPPEKIQAGPIRK